MCGVLGILAHTPVNQAIYDGLLVLQHRGQDAAGIVTATPQGAMCMHKGAGLVSQVFRTQNMRALEGSSGIGHVRYPTAGTRSGMEAQPFYVNSPLGIALGHNGNLTNCAQLHAELRAGAGVGQRHINTRSDSEVLLNVLAQEIQRSLQQPSRQGMANVSATPADFLAAVARLHQRVRGAYAVVALIAGHGLLAFRDPHGIRPLLYGQRTHSNGPETLVASESVALDALGFQRVRDLAPGEALFVDYRGQVHLASSPMSVVNRYTPCLFEYVYFARPDSVMNGVSVYQARLAMGAALAERVRAALNTTEIDVVMPIPDSSRPSALQLAHSLGLPYREGFQKNHYIGRTFIMPGQALRRKSVRQKLNAIAQEFAGRAVLLVDDSIVRGTTAREIVQMAREAGARAVYFASAAPPVRFPHIYGIDMPTAEELISNDRDAAAVAREIGADAVVYQDLAALHAVITQLSGGQLTQFEDACFSGCYITDDAADYLAELACAHAAHQKTTEEQRGYSLGLSSPFSLTIDPAADG